jgi:hypothetical protein
MAFPNSTMPIATTDASDCTDFFVRTPVEHRRISKAPPDLFAKARENGPEVAAVYRRHGLETDIAVHVHHYDTDSRNGVNNLASQLTAALRDYGLVEHTVWEEMS